MIYLDHAANTPALPFVMEHFCTIEKQYPFNPNATNPLAKPGKQVLRSALDTIATCLNTSPDAFIVTSSATESNNLAIKGLCAAYRHQGRHIITSYMEHASVNGPITALLESGYQVDYVAIDSTGQVDLIHLKSLLRSDTVLVAIHHVDSEVGVIQNIDAIGACVKNHSQAFFHVDGTQAVGKITVNLTTTHYIDTYAFSAHKFHGLNGVAALYLKSGLLLEPLHHGGLSQSPFRSGTVTLSLLSAMALALEWMTQNLKVHHTHVVQLNTTIRHTLAQYDKVTINSPTDASPYILNLSIKEIKAESVMNALADDAIFIATKSACSAINSPSRSVYALTGDRKAALSTLRISLSPTTTVEAVETFLTTFHTILQHLS